MNDEEARTRWRPAPAARDRAVGRRGFGGRGLGDALAAQRQLRLPRQSPAGRPDAEGRRRPRRRGGGGEPAQGRQEARARVRRPYLLHRTAERGADPMHPLPRLAQRLEGARAQPDPRLPAARVPRQGAQAAGALGGGGAVGRRVVGGGAAGGGGPRRRRRGRGGRGGREAKAPEKRTRGADRPAAGGGEKEEAKPEPLGEKGWELQAKFKSVRTANVRVPQQHNHYDCGVYMLKFIDQAANDTETMEAVSIDAMRGSHSARRRGGAASSTAGREDRRPHDRRLRVHPERSRPAPAAKQEAEERRAALGGVVSERGECKHT